MPQAPERLRDYLAADEQLTAVYSASLAEDSPWIPVTLGVTDRRVLCVSESGRVVTIGLDGIGAIRSRPRTKSSYRGNDYRLLMGVGGLVVVLSFVGVAALSSSAFVTFLLPVFVAGLASAEYHRRRTSGIDVSSAVRAARRAAFEDGESLGRSDARATDSVDDRQVLLLGNGLAAVVSFGAIVVLSASALVVFLSLATVGGVALIDYARRHAAEYDGIEIIQRREREVSITTDDGSTVHIRCDPSDEVDRVLSERAFVDGSEPIRSVSPRS